MKDDENTAPKSILRIQPSTGKPGRPRAIPAELKSVILDLYSRGYGYRAIARILRTDFNIGPDFSTVRRTLKRLGVPPRQASPSKQPLDR